MGGHKMKPEFITDDKCRYRVCQNRQNGLKKKLQELSTLCDVKACMILYTPYVDGTQSSFDQPSIWPENQGEVESVVEKYKKERKGDSRKRTWNASDVDLAGRREAVHLGKQKMEEKGFQNMPGLDRFSYEQLKEIIGKLEKTQNAVQNMIQWKKSKASSMGESSLEGSRMQGVLEPKPVNIRVPMKHYDQSAIGPTSTENMVYQVWRNTVHCHPAFGVPSENVYQFSGWECPKA